MSLIHKHNKPTLQTALALLKKVDITAHAGAARMQNASDKLSKPKATV
jgi:hypothetical protein